MKRLLKKLLKTLLVLALIAAVTLTALGYLEYRSVTRDNPIESAVSTIQNDSDFVAYDALPQRFVEAVVATEDARFWSRESVLDYEALGRAMLRNLKNLKMLEGGSTIPQQVGKNLYFDHSASLIRKVSEWFVARDLLKTYNKRDVLSLYVNMNYYGDGYYGIYDASYGYFNVHPSMLTDGQATLLAGLPQAPSIYQLSTNFEGARQRQLHVLERMLDVGYLNENEKNTIYAENVYGE